MATFVRDPMKCWMCDKPFDEDQHCLRFLACGCRICTQCITIKESGIEGLMGIMCPYCRKRFKESSPGECSINRSLMETLQYTKEVSKDSPFDYLLKEIKKGVSDMELQLNQGFKEKLCKAETNIKDLAVHMSRTKKELFLGGEYSDLMKVKEVLGSRLLELVEIEKEVQVLNGRAEAAKNFSDIGFLLDQIPEMNERVKNIKLDAYKCLEFYQEEKSRFKQNVEKTRMEFTLLMDLANLLEKDCDDRQPKNIYIYLENEMDEDEGAGARVTVDNVKQLTLPVRQLIWENRIMVFHDHAVLGRRYARISVSEDGLLCVHHLKALGHCLPRNVQLIEHKDLMGSNPPKLMFLDLDIEGRPLGRVMIRLDCPGKYETNFRLLCTGETGPSYANSGGMTINEQPGDHPDLHMGEYLDTESRVTGRPVISEEDWNELYSGTYIPSIVNRVFAISDNLEEASKFYIELRSKKFFVKATPYLGTVEKGLDLLRDANKENVDKWTISGCGVVFNRKL